RGGDRGLGLLGRAVVLLATLDLEVSGVELRQRLRLGAEDELRILAGGLAIPVLHVHGDDLACTELAEEDLLGELVLDLALDRATQRAGTQSRVEATLGEQVLGLLADLDAHVLVLQGAAD